MKRKRHQRSGPDGLVPEEEEEPGTEAQHDVEDEDRLKRLLEAAGAAMPEVSDGDGDGEAPADSHLVHSEDPMSDSKVEKTVLAESVMTIVAETAEEEMALTEIVPNMRRFFFCSSSSSRLTSVANFGSRHGAGKVGIRILWNFLWCVIMDLVKVVMLRTVDPG